MEKRVAVNILISTHPGLDAPGAAKFARVASQFDAEISLYLRGARANAKSILGLLSLCARQGDTVAVVAEGDDAVFAVEALQALFISGAPDEAAALPPDWPDRPVSRARKPGDSATV
jgi:phosphotransferase system HPr (HPr) family protein